MTPRVAIITCYDEGYAPIADVTLPIMQRYATKHGYGLHIGKYHTDPRNLFTYGDRLKISLFNEHYDAHDIICFLDIDVLVMNSEIKIEEVLMGHSLTELSKMGRGLLAEAAREKMRPFLWTYDPNGPCSGFWIARCIPDVHLVLNAVKNRCPEYGKVSVKESLGPPHSVTLQMEPHGSSDQMMMRDLMNIPPFSSVLKHCVSGKEAGHCFSFEELGWPPAWNHLGNYEPGDFLLTFPSSPMERRLELLKLNAEKAT